MATLSSKIRTVRVVRCSGCGLGYTVPHNLRGPSRCPSCANRRRVGAKEAVSEREVALAKR